MSKKSALQKAKELFSGKSNNDATASNKEDGKAQASNIERKVSAEEKAVVRSNVFKDALQRRRAKPVDNTQRDEFADKLARTPEDF